MKSGKTFEEIQDGERFSGAMTVTESHVVLAAGIFGDLAPLHVNEVFAEKTRFRTRIAHGTLTTGIMAGVLSSYFYGTAIGYLEQYVRFLAPVNIGDTVFSEWEVVERLPKRKLGGGIVSFKITCRIQDGTPVLEGTAKAVISSQPYEPTAPSSTQASMR